MSKYKYTYFFETLFFIINYFIITEPNVIYNIFSFHLKVFLTSPRFQFRC